MTPFYCFSALHINVVDQKSHRRKRLLQTTVTPATIPSPVEIKTVFM